MDKNLFSLRMKVEEAEEDFNSLKKKTGEIPFAYEECQKAINRQKEIWECVLHYSKGTDSERQVYQKLDELEEKQFMKKLNYYMKKLERRAPMKIMYEELSDVKSSIRSERLNAVGSFNSVTSSIDGLAGNRNLLGGGWVSTVSHLQAYQEIDKALFNVYYEMDNSLNSYLTDFVGEVGKTDEVLDTDDLEGLLRDLQTAQNEYTNLMSDLAKSMKNVPVLGDFFKQQSIDPIKEDIEILQKYQAFESSHASHYSELSSLISDVNTGLAQLGNPANFLNPRDGYRIVDYGNQQWFKNLKGYNDSQPKSRVETVTELDVAGNVVYVVYTNGVKDEKLTAQLTEAMKESWLDRSIDAVAQFLDIVGNVVKTTLGVVTTITGIIGTIGGCAVVTLATGGVGILIDGVIVTEGVIVTTAGVALTVDGVNGLTTSNFASKGGAGEQRSLKKIDGNKAANKQAKKQGYDDAHDFKESFVGENAVSKFDILYDTVTGQILLKSQRGNIIIETGHFFIK